VEVLKRRDAYDRDPEKFQIAWSKKTAQIRDLITTARQRLSAVNVDDETLEIMSRLCMALGADGLRGELTLMRSARAAAALDGEASVGRDHIRRVAPMALRHRLRRNPLEESGSAVRIELVVDEVLAA
jgi:magnesium chelatase subunit I